MSAVRSNPEADLGTTLRRIVPGALSRRADRVIAIESGSRLVWIKRALPTKSRPMHRAQRIAARILPLPILGYTGDVSGQDALDREARVLRRLHERGVRVPEVLASGPGWLALGDLGPSLEQLIAASATPAAARQLALAGAWALLRLHRQGGWHGAPQIRNLTGPADRIGFLDFEEDVGARLDFASAQTRDWILFLCSLYRPERRFPGLLEDIVKDVRADLPPHVRRFLLKARICAAPVAFLALPFARWLGRDVRQCLALWRALGRLDPRRDRRFRLARKVGSAFGLLHRLLARHPD